MCESHIGLYIVCVCVCVHRAENEKVLCLKDCLDRSVFSCGCKPILCTEVSNNEIKEMIEVIETINESE